MSRSENCSVTMKLRWDRTVIHNSMILIVDLFESYGGGTDEVWIKRDRVLPSREGSELPRSGFGTFTEGERVDVKVLDGKSRGLWSLGG